MENSNNIKCSQSNKIFSEKALELFLNKFFELHPKQSWPKWIRTHTDWAKFDEKSNIYKLGIVAWQKKELGANECYEEVNGREFLTKINPQTKQKEYVVNIRGVQMITIFQVLVDEKNFAVEVLLDTDLLLIDSKQLIKLR